MELVLERNHFADDFTLGALYGIAKRLAYSCEDAVRGDGDAKTVEKWKIPGKSAIPYGRYRLIISFSQRFQKHLPMLLDVPGFSGVRMHGGNTSADTEGCILLGLSIRQNGVGNCKPAVDMIIKLIQDSATEVWLTVTTNA